MAEDQDRFAEIRVGDKASMIREIDDADVRAFAKITRDTNPIHLNDQYAQRSIFKRRVVHGLFSAAIIGAVLGTQLPGPGSIYLSQTLRFMAATCIGDTITATVEVTEKITEKRWVKLRTSCTNQQGKQVIDGEALMLIPQR